MCWIEHSATELFRQVAGRDRSSIEKHQISLEWKYHYQTDSLPLDNLYSKDAFKLLQMYKIYFKFHLI